VLKLLKQKTAKFIAWVIRGAASFVFEVSLNMKKQRLTQDVDSPESLSAEFENSDETMNEFYHRKLNSGTPRKSLFDAFAALSKVQEKKNIGKDKSYFIEVHHDLTGSPYRFVFQHDSSGVCPCCTTGLELEENKTIYFHQVGPFLALAFTGDSTVFMGRVIHKVYLNENARKLEKVIGDQSEIVYHKVDKA